MTPWPSCSRPAFRSISPATPPRLETLQPDYADCWDGLERKFDGTPGIEVIDWSAAGEIDRDAASTIRNCARKHETRHAEGRHARRQAGGRLARPDALHRGGLPRAARCRRRSTTGSVLAPRLADARRMARTRRRAVRCASTSTTRIRRCRAPISGRTARPTSTTSSWCARRAAPRCRQSFWTDPLMYQGGSDCLPRPARSDRHGRRSLGHRLRGRGRRHHRRRADGRERRRGARG